MKQFCQVIISPATNVLFSLLTLPIVASRAADQGSDLYWIFLADKGASLPVDISEQALLRRTTRSANSGFSWYDKPVNPEYMVDLKDRNIRLRHVSRWLNAVSAFLDETEVRAVRELPYVDRVSRVSSFSRPRTIAVYPAPPFASGATVYDYGPSYSQISLVNVDSLHNLGLSGNGVMIGIMDTGFDTSHVAFSRLVAENRIVATYDFINNDSNVVDQPDVQRTHGTQVLSVLGGFAEGSLIGPAFGAGYVLAKTEIVTDEIQAEEDNWVAAAEWMESLGVDIISSSLGYIDWYDTTQLDGQTAVITRAADAAASLGVVVVNAAGNEGNTPWRKVIPPADGDSVIAVGAVDLTGDIADFSSRGPTVDGRIKPDFCALGVGVYVAGWTGGYGFAGGTSFAAPVVSGGIALLLEGHPGWTLDDLLGTMKASSSRYFLPNNTFGWGLPDFAAAFYGQPGIISDGNISILIAPHPAVDSVSFYLTLPNGGRGELSIHDVSGARVGSFDVEALDQSVVRMVWSGRNEHGRQVSSGIYICNLEIGGQAVTEKFFFISE